MSRLIDADKIEINEECTFSGKEIKAFLNAIPTAYDVDKVGEQLEYYLFEKYCVEGDTKVDEILQSGGIE